MFKINSDVHGYSTRHADDYHISFSGTNSFKILFATILVEHYVILIRCILHVKGRYDSSINVQSSITSHQNTASYHAAFQLWTCQRRGGYPTAVSLIRQTLFVRSSADVKRASDGLTPVLTEICNASLQSGDLPETQKWTLGFPRLKKPMLDSEDANSYRPISNLSFTSKFVERVVATRFTAHAERCRLFPSNQSAYCWHHNMETAVVSVMNDIIRAIDRGEVIALVLLDLSAAFDTVEHCTLLDVLHRRLHYIKTFIVRSLLKENKRITRRT